MNAMRWLYTTDQLRAIETAALAVLPPGTLMQRAGAAAAEMAITLLYDAKNIIHTSTAQINTAQFNAAQINAAHILIIAGPGNNGGDALVAASCLVAAGASVSVKLCGDLAHLPADAQLALQHLRTTTVRFIELIAPMRWSLVIDGLLGIGLTRPIDGELAALVDTVNAFDCPRLSLDVPSGLNADTGALIGDTGCAIHATHTLTFIGDKPGLHTAAGRDVAGVVSVTDLDIDHAFFVPTSMQLGSTGLFANAVQLRRHDSHKGSYGDVVVMGGADGLTGAVLLAARAALHAGGGRVFAAFVGAGPTHDVMHPELMCRRAGDMDFGKSVIVAGPGLGLSALSLACLRRVLQQSNALVLDADALNLIASNTDAQTQLAARSPSALLMTPHPLEAARLLGCSAAVIQTDRVAAAKTLAQRYQAVVILKGSGSVIAHPDGSVVINPNGNPGLATAGSGDVLSGLCGALLAQRWPVWEAALAAVWLHGRAADMLVGNGIGPIGLTASELPAAIRQALNALNAKASVKFAALPQS